MVVWQSYGQQMPQATHVVHTERAAVIGVQLNG